MQFKDTWNQCGFILINKPNKRTEPILKESRERLRLYQIKDDSETKFKKIAGNKKMLFFKTKQELMDAYKAIGSKNIEELYKDLNFGENCMLMASKTNNFLLSFNYAAAIYTDYNTLYDKKFAKEYAIDFYTKDDFIDYREVCDLHDGNYLPEAQVYTSNGVKQDKLFVRKYGNYIIDYFFEGTRKYDYDEKRWYVTYGIKTGIM